MFPVPHISARALKNKDELEYFVKDLSENCGVTEVLVISGSSGYSSGDFHETMQILDTGVLQKYNIKKVGVAGHPEGSPDISNDLIMDSLKRKFEWSLKTKIPIYIETQFLFEAEPVLKWEEEMNTSSGDRWLLIIAFVIGLSFGVHFMGLLTIPALGMIYYFKNYKTNNTVLQSDASIFCFCSDI